MLYALTDNYRSLIETSLKFKGLGVPSLLEVQGLVFLVIFGLYGRSLFVPL